MEALTRAIWVFMEGSYRKGVLDELLGLVGALSDPEVDLGEQLGAFEDRLSGADFSGFEEMSAEVLTPLLQALADEKVLESLHVLLVTTRPLIDAFMDRVGGDTNVAGEMLGLIKQNLVCLMTVAGALTPVLAKVYGPMVETFLKESGPALAADLINTANGAINRNPETATHIVSDLFAKVDGKAFGTAVDTVMGAVLDQKPPLVEWTAGTLMKRTKKRLFG
jgi:hypothetical protein